MNFFSVVFGSILVSIQSLVLGPPCSVKCGLPVQAWVLCCTSHWLATPSNYVSLLPKHMLQALWLCWYPSTSNGSLVWLEKINGSGSISPTIRIFARVTLVNSLKFPLRQVSTSLLKCPTIPLPLPGHSPSIPSQHRLPIFFFPTCTPNHQQKLFYFLFTGRSMCSFI